VTGDWSNGVVNGNLPTTLNSVTASMGGKPVYICYTSPGQLNVLAPNVSPGPISVTVTTAGGTSSPFATGTSLNGPAFFLWPGNQRVATRQDYSLVVKPGTFSTATAAAKPCEVIILWGTGFGPTNPSVPIGGGGARRTDLRDRDRAGRHAQQFLSDCVRGSASIGFCGTISNRHPSPDCACGWRPSDSGHHRRGAIAFRRVALGSGQAGRGHKVPVRYYQERTISTSG
jgi:hypothetical protein